MNDGPYVIPPCNDGPGDPSHPAATGEKLVHDCYDPRDLRTVDNSAPPDLRSTGEKALSLVMPKSEYPATQMEIAERDVQKAAWQDFANDKVHFPTTDEAKSAYFTLMRGYGFTTPEPGKLTAAQSEHVNIYGENHSASSAIFREQEPNFKHLWTPQKN